MKILVVSDTYYPIIDGVCRFIDQLGLILSKAGHSVHFLVPKLHNHYYFDYKSRPFDFTFLPTFPKSIRDYYLCLPTPRMIKRIKEADLIIVNSLAFSAIYTILINGLYKKTVVQFVHIDERQLLLKTIGLTKKLAIPLVNFLKYLTQKVDYFAVATNKFFRKTKAYGAPQERIFQVPFGYNPKQIDIDYLKSFKQKLKIDTNDKVVIYVGRFSDEKNLPVTIDVMGNLQRDNQNLKTFVAGSGYMEKEIVNQIKTKQYDVNLLGKIPDGDLPYLYSVADILLSPSYHESLGFTIVESMNYGTIPAINGKFRENSLTSENAILIDDVSNVENIMKLVSECLADEIQLNKMKEKILFDSKQFDWDIFGKIWLDKITEISKLNSK